MSILKVNQIRSPKNGSILFDENAVLLQMTRMRYDSRTSVSSTGLQELTFSRIAITPKRSDSYLMIMWHLSIEIQNHDTTMRLFKNGSVITTSGREGYNNNVGQTNYSGYRVANYDGDDSSTPHTLTTMYHTPSENTSARHYSMGFRTADSSSNKNIYINRTVGSNGQDSHENGVSTAVIYEFKIT